MNIKLRVFSKKDNAFIIPCETKEYNDVDLIYADQKWYFLGGNKLDDNYIISIFTGLKDKNGKDIYEGDILEVPPYASHYGNSKVTIKMKVVYYQNLASFKLDPITNQGYGGCKIEGNNQYLFSIGTVIGNVYENNSN